MLFNEMTGPAPPSSRYPLVKLPFSEVAVAPPEPERQVLADDQVTEAPLAAPRSLIRFCGAAWVAPVMSFQNVPAMGTGPAVSAEAVLMVPFGSLAPKLTLMMFCAWAATGRAERAIVRRAVRRRTLRLVFMGFVGFHPRPAPPRTETGFEGVLPMNQETLPRHGKVEIERTVIFPMDSASNAPFFTGLAPGEGGKSKNRHQRLRRLFQTSRLERSRSTSGMLIPERAIATCFSRCWFQRAVSAADGV